MSTLKSEVLIWKTNEDVYDCYVNIDDERIIQFPTDGKNISHLTKVHIAN